MCAILWPLWGYKVMAGLIFFLFLPSKKQSFVVPSSHIFTDTYRRNWILVSSFPSLLYANSCTFVLLLFLFLFFLLPHFLPTPVFIPAGLYVTFPTLLCLFRDRENWELPCTLCIWFHKYYTLTWRIFFHSIFFFHPKLSWICKSRLVQA